MARSELERDIERWWERQAEEVADCTAADPTICGTHVFEEAVRIEGVIVACTVRGDLLASSLAAFLLQAQREREEEYKRMSREAAPIKLFQVNHPMAAYLATETIDPETFRREREGNWAPPVPPPGMPARPDGERGRCGGRFGGGRCTCLTAEEHYGETREQSP